MIQKKKICSNCKRKRPIWKRIEGKGFCRYCAGVANTSQSKFKPTRKQKPISPRSSKRKVQDKEYSKLRKEFLEKNPFCQARLSKCQTRASQVHHKKGRGKYYLDVSTWLSSCANCHHMIETMPSMAKALGFSESRLA